MFHLLQVPKGVEFHLNTSTFSAFIPKVSGLLPQESCDTVWAAVTLSLVPKVMGLPTTAAGSVQGSGPGFSQGEATGWEGKVSECAPGSAPWHSCLPA